MEPTNTPQPPVAVVADAVPQPAAPSSEPSTLTPKSADVTEVKLPISGKMAVVKRGKGRDLLAAAREAPDSESVNFALIAQLTTIEGQDLFLDDVLELDLHDVNALQTAIQGKAPIQK